MAAQREVMRGWATTNRQTHIDLFDLYPTGTVFYDGPGVHIAGNTEGAHVAQLILERLQWISYPESQGKNQPVKRLGERTASSELADSTTLAEDTSFRLKGLTAGRWRLKGNFIFSNDDSAGEGAKVSIGFGGTATLSGYKWCKWENNNTQVPYSYPGFGFSAGVPFEMNGATGYNQSYGFELTHGTFVVASPGDVIVKIAKEATGGSVHIRESSWIEAEKLP
jgi:hypothetical protein